MNIIIKTKELIFHRPHTTKFDVPCTLDGIAQEHVAKLLGVFFSDTLRFEAHVNFLSTDEIVETPRLTTDAAADCIYCPDTLTHYMLSQSGVTISPISKGSELIHS